MSGVEYMLGRVARRKIEYGLLWLASGSECVDPIAGCLELFEAV